MLFKFIRCTILFIFFIIPAEAQDSIDLPLKTPDSLIKPLPSLLEFSNKHDIALNYIKMGGTDSQPGKGDSITYLLTLYQGSSIQQWLAIFTQDLLTPDEARLEPLPEETIYASTGRVFKFKNTRTALIFILIGPFTGKKSESEKKYINQLRNPFRIFVSREKLNCGLDKYVKTAMALTKRCDAAGVRLSNLFHIGSSSPISESDLEKGQPYSEYATDEEERLIFNVGFAFDTFYSAAMAVDELKQIVDKVIEKPSISSIISNGVRIRRFISFNPEEVHFFNANSLGIENQAYEQPLKLFLNHKIALKASIIMVGPRPPLQVCAGIVALYAEHPVEKGNRLLIQLFSAYRKPHESA